MSKAGLNIMTKSLAVEWAQYGIRLNAIAPGPFPTKGAWERLNPGAIRSGTMGTAEDSSSAASPMGRVGQMQELRNLATFLMADGCDFLTGETIAIDGGGFLAGGGNFAQLAKLGDSDWAAIRDMIKGANEKDKAKRTV
jgi:NAD(P)-dependent dehydrogenase (short-subunit alcohol dehydrogenase family)